ncbi:NADH-quinone oxidoreductase subunit N [Fibrobacterales bacterium]|nr:NADH-quinone oxidoreductase subunit N [Fibrobacterales bacterium]
MNETSLFYDLKIIFPVIAIALGGIVALATESFLSRDGKHSVLPWINVFFLAVAAFILYSISGAGFDGVWGDNWNLFAINWTRELFIYAIILCTFLGTAGLQSIMRAKKFSGGEGYPLLMFSASGIMLMVLSADLLPLFLGMELASFPIYALVAINRHSHKSNESAYKYFISGALFSAVFLYGIALFYGATGSTNLGASFLDGRESIYGAGVLLLTIGLLFKIGAFPLHFWVADAYSGTLATVTGFMAAVVKIGAFTALSALWLGILNDGSAIAVKREAVLFFVLGLASVAVGAITGLAQTSARRVLAFSAVANAGFILLGFAYPYFANSSAESVNLSPAFYFLLTYALGSAGALTGISVLMSHDFDDLNDLRGKAKKNPFIGTCITVCLASLAGLPIAAGFLAKFRVFSGLVSSSFETPIVWGFAIAAFILAIISAVYYLRIIYYLWSNNLSAKKQISVPAMLTAAIGAITLSLLILAVWIPI